MKNIITYELLKSLPDITIERLIKMSEAEAIKAQADLWSDNVFLSHSTKDHDLLPKAAYVLEKNGGKVYIDDNDPNLTGSDIFEIAKNLRVSVKSCRKFV